jgi:high-affinity iron transporter
VKTVFNFNLLRTAVAGALVMAAVGVARAAPDAKSVEQLAALVSYVAADYAGAVKEGAVVAQSEYDEQKEMLAEARAVAAKIAPNGGPLVDDVARLEAAFARKAPDKEISAAAQAIGKRLLDAYGLRLAPAAPPSEERARSVYATTCAQCHGSDGRGDGPQAKGLTPPPLSFFDDEKMARVSPALAYQALTFGVRGTAMAAFDALPASDRWSLAYFVVGKRYADVDLAKGRATWSGIASPPVAATAAELAPLSDAQLDEKLAPALPDAAARRNVIAWLRREASFRRSDGGRFAEARRLVGELVAATENEPPAKWKQRAIAAYLEGVEPEEAALRARSVETAELVERAFGELRRASEKGDAAAVREAAARANLVLDGAEEKMAGGGASVPFLAALAIALREGFELSLLLAALLAFVRKSGRPELARDIHLGWLAAVPAGAIAWFAVGAVLGGARRELTEGILTLVAAAMLLFVSHFVLGRLESRKWLKFLERKTTTAAKGQAAEGRAVAWPLVSVAFVAAFREAIEIVLFFRALLLDAPGVRGALLVLGGATTGVVGLVILVKTMGWLGRRLNPRPLMLVSGIVLTVIAISLVGQGVRALQEGGYLSLTPVNARLRVGPLGIYPTVEGLVAQGIVLMLVVVPAWLERRKGTAEPAAKAPA